MGAICQRERKSAFVGIGVVDIQSGVHGVLLVVVVFVRRGPFYTATVYKSTCLYTFFREPFMVDYTGMMYKMCDPLRKESEYDDTGSGMFPHRAEVTR